MDGINGRTDVACQRNVSVHFDAAAGSSSIHTRRGSVTASLSPPFAIALSLHSGVNGDSGPLVSPSNGSTFTPSKRRHSASAAPPAGSTQSAASLPSQQGSAGPYNESSAAVSLPLRTVRGHLVAVDSFQDFAVSDEGNRYSPGGGSTGGGSTGGGGGTRVQSAAGHQRLSAGRGKISDSGRLAAAASLANKSGSASGGVGGSSGSNSGSGSGSSDSGGQDGAPSTPRRPDAALVVTAVRGRIHVTTLSWLEKIKRKLALSRSEGNFSS